ncbi:hypothetical protein B9G39_21695 [Zooshikella ganghwensis]|uniref:Uncharacterized protein n=2 Tax=Zooshikella ganghwensis TaxID=202772 RepID=A0A4P9VU76_9GAMM|nr:hypothetical protein B9G39_21695 [Zooshikella ganghwensis]
MNAVGSIDTFSKLSNAKSGETYYYASKSINELKVCHTGRDHYVLKNQYAGYPKTIYHADGSIYIPEVEIDGYHSLAVLNIKENDSVEITNLLEYFSIPRITLSLSKSPSCDYIQRTGINRGAGLLKIISLNGNSDVNAQLQEWELNAFDSQFDPTKMEDIGG